MKCKVCGAYNEDYLEYCEKCAAPLTADTESEKTVEIQQPENEQNMCSFMLRLCPSVCY